MIRTLARPMLASVYIVDGAETIKNTRDHVEGAEAVIKRTKAVLPPEYAKAVPNDPELVARSVGGVKVGAGSLLAIGKAPRLSAGALAAATVPTILARYAFWETQDKKEKAERRTGFLTHLGLLGGLAITAVDTEGRPGLKWRAGKAAEKASGKVQAALPGRKETEGFVDNAKNRLSETVDQAQKYIDENKDDWRETAQDRAAKVSDTVSTYAQQARGFIDENKDDWLETARRNADTAKHKLVTVASEAQEKATAAAREADRKAGRKGRRFDKKAGKLQKRADKALKKARRKLG